MPPTPPRADFVPQVRAVSLSDYVEVAGSVGLDPYAMLAEFGIRPSQLEDPETRISARAANRLLDESALRSGCESFGLLMAEKRSFASIGPLSLVLRHERTLRTVINQMIAYRRLISDVFDLELDEAIETAELRLGLPPAVAGRQAVELTMALTCLILNEAMFGGLNSVAACFRHPAPGDAKIHRRVFRCPLNFDAPFNGFLLASSSLDRDNAFADEGFAGHAQRYVDQLVRELPDTDFAEQVRSAIRSLLPAGQSSLAKVASLLDIHPRALQRRLVAEGIRFTDLVETVREDMARNLLGTSALPITEIGLLLGYGSPASFSRWFTGRLGRSPREWRNEAAKRE
jgi:AraC-like DNA-binding protein